MYVILGVLSMLLRIEADSICEKLDWNIIVWCKKYTRFNLYASQNCIRALHDVAANHCCEGCTMTLFVRVTSSYRGRFLQKYFVNYIIQYHKYFHSSGNYAQFRKNRQNILIVY